MSGSFSKTLLLIFILCTGTFSCTQTKKEKTARSLMDATNMKFIETRREFDTGLSFSKHGFQQVPEWTLFFLPGDSVKIYSPFEKKYIYYPIYYDHNEVVNFAREWLRIKHVSKDSLVLQLLQVTSKVVTQDPSKVYMRFYSEDFIHNNLRESIEDLRRPSHTDTLFIKQLISRANKYPEVSDSVFAATQPVEFKSKSSVVTVKKENRSEAAAGKRTADIYLYPEYFIEIRKAYKDFNYTCMATVDVNGKIRVTSFAVLEKEFEEPRRRVLQGIVDVYLHNLLEIKPGRTLNIPHASEITLNIKGIVSEN